jgi:hypothetical protein
MTPFYELFPERSIHERESITSTLSNKRLQQRLMQVLRNVNCRTFTFEDIGNPTIPDCSVIFEVGIAESNSFTFIDEDEAKKVLTALRNKPFKMMDFFCAIRYYKDFTSTKKPLKFDYYMMRFIFPKEGLLEMQIFHERGPRYVSPKDLTAFLMKKINDVSAKKVLTKVEPRDNID